MAFGRTFPAAKAPPRRPQPLRTLWLLCIAAGLVLCGSFGYATWRGFDAQQQLNRQWQAAYHAAPPPAPTSTTVASVDPNLKRSVNGIDFAIRIPRLGYFAAVKEGVGTGVLYSGPGHYPTTMWPGDAGTVGIAAHNVYWINFPQLVKGDEVDVETRYGTYRYRVTGSEIVNPGDRSVLVPDADGFHLTLTTCWPLWAGAFATQRYVIFTDQVWPIPIRRSYT